MFIDMFVRKSAKPACISALMLRARARAAASRGHSACCGKRSASVSTIASDSQTASPASVIRHGTLPDGECVEDLRLRVGLAETDQHFVERNAEMLEQQPRPHRPGRVVLVTDNEFHAIDE